MKTTRSAKAGEIKRKWYILDARDRVLGRLATRAARLLTGKDKPLYTPHVDCGDHVIIINAEKVKVTGRKLEEKVYYHHTGYLGHLKSANLTKVLKEKPERALRSAVQGMVPKSSLGRDMLRKLRIYAGDQHPHAAQKPVALTEREEK